MLIPLCIYSLKNNQSTLHPSHPQTSSTIGIRRSIVPIPATPTIVPTVSAIDFLFLEKTS